VPHESKSSPREIQNYLGRISKPLLDRIDLHIEVPPVKFREMANPQPGETSAQIVKQQLNTLNLTWSL
jgi:magnesium chelatase family protein